MSDSRTYLDSYVLQQDMRIRLPKAILNNLPAEKGETIFDIFYDSKNNEIILKIRQEKEHN